MMTTPRVNKSTNTADQRNFSRPPHRTGVTVGTPPEDSVSFPPSKDVNSASGRQPHHSIGILSPEAGEAAGQGTFVGKPKTPPSIGILDLLNTEQTPGTTFPKQKQAETVSNRGFSNNLSDLLNEKEIEPTFRKQKRAKVVPDRGVSNDLSAGKSPDSSVLPNELSTETHPLPPTQEEWLQTQLQKVEDRLWAVYDNDARYSAQCTAFLEECFAPNFGQLPDDPLLDKERENEYRWKILLRVCSCAMCRFTDKTIITTSSRKHFPVENSDQIAWDHFKFIIPFIVPGKIHTKWAPRWGIANLSGSLPMGFCQKINFRALVRRTAIG